ncbi:hypothetical protein FACS1894147_11330 [Spirochaetia bacterium]|nr:hypothetical protein FACS1894147_11330 [Spirochaetia bacterium]
MAGETVFQGKIDPESAEPPGIDVSSAPEEVSIPPLDGILDDLPGNVTKKLEETPHNFFNDPDYYKIVLSDEGAAAQRFHGLLQQYLSIKDPKEKSLFRPQMIPAAWDLLAETAKRAPGNMEAPKRFFLRFALFHPTLLDAAARTFFARIIVEKAPDQPVYYLDEWLRAIGEGAIKPSAADEAKLTKSNVSAHFQLLMSKAKGKMDGARVLLTAKHNERR